MGSIAPHAKSAVSNAQCHNKQQANSTAAQSNDHMDHSATNTLPMYASNYVHHTKIGMDALLTLTTDCSHQTCNLWVSLGLQDTSVCSSYPWPDPKVAVPTENTKNPKHHTGYKG